MQCQQFIQLLEKSLARKPTHSNKDHHRRHHRSLSNRFCQGCSRSLFPFIPILLHFFRFSQTAQEYYDPPSVFCLCLLGVANKQPTQISARETKPLNNEWRSAKAHLHCRFSFEDVPEKKRKTVKILCRQDPVLNLHRLLLFCGRFSQRLNMWLLLFAMVLSSYLLLQRPAAAAEEEECLRSFLMCFLCLRSDGNVVVVLLTSKRQWTSSFQDEVVALCVCVCVFSFAHDVCLRDFPEYSAFGHRHMMRSMMRACFPRTSLPPDLDNFG
jgi:hypothetical protein